MNRNSLKGLWYAGSNLSNLSIRFGEIRIISLNLLDSIPRNGQWFHTNSYEIVTIYIRQILFQRPSLVMSILVVLQKISQSNYAKIDLNNTYIDLIGYFCCVTTTTLMNGNGLNAYPSPVDKVRTAPFVQKARLQSFCEWTLQGKHTRCT